MMHIQKNICIFLFFLSLSFSCFSEEKCSKITNEVLGNGLCTKIKTYKSERISSDPVLLVALHGDTAPWNISVSQYEFAKHVAHESTNLIAIGMLRPGYIDKDKRASDGIQGEGIGDNYDEPRVLQIAESIRTLKEHYNASKVVLVGQSGGAATTANLIGMHPELIDHALLLACPCDIKTWLSNMFKLTKKSVFKDKLNRTSPIDIVGQISNKTKITMLVGKDDLVAPPKLSRRYQSALLAAGKSVNLRVIPGGHDIFLSNAAVSGAANIVVGYNKALQWTSR